MAGSKGSKYYDVFLKYKIWLENNEGIGILGDGRIEMLKIIQEKKSLKAASEQMGISYRKAWGNLKTIESRLDFAIVQKKRGGSGGGETILTKEGEELIEAFDELRSEFDEAIYRITKKFFSKINR